MGRDVHVGCACCCVQPPPLITCTNTKITHNIKGGKCGAEKVNFWSNFSLEAYSGVSKLKTAIVVLLLTRGICIFMHTPEHARAHTHIQRQCGE